MNRPTLAIIGSGPSSIYLLKHLLDEAVGLGGQARKISIFERSRLTGVGMPYSPQTTDRFNLANIASEELPELPVSLVDWLKSLDALALKEMNLQDAVISEEKIYPRLVLGRYLNEQYRTIISRLAGHGVEVHEYAGCEIADVIDRPQDDEVTLVTAEGAKHFFDRVVIATGHTWKELDRPSEGYYSSPWPISKLLPEEGEHYNFAIGTLGASLSAFDVITSLAHRHGEFVKKDDGLEFRPASGTEDFRIVMHASHGWLPHLQFDQDEPLRDIYRHADRETLLGLVDREGYLRIDVYFDVVCRAALSKAFAKDGLEGMVRHLADPDFGLKDFVKMMSDKHDYADPFEGMRREMVEARESVLEHKPIHWKEVIDDLIYTLNFHAELMAAEDHIVLQSVVMPFLMNVIAAMPLESGEIILALYDAGKLSMISGNVEVGGDLNADGMTEVTVESDSKKTTEVYRMFVDCSGQKPLELGDYPFAGLVERGTTRAARALFANASGVADVEDQERVLSDNGHPAYRTGGVDIDGAYRLIGHDGAANPRIHDISFPHTSGARPYSYGLQSCSDTGAIVVQAWLKEIREGQPMESDAEEMTRLYEKL